MSGRGERRARTERVVKRRCTVASDFWRKTPGRLKKRSPVCYCVICRLGRKKARNQEG